MPQTLAQTVKSKYPQYNSVPDAELEKLVKTKYPGVYDHLPTSTPKPGYFGGIKERVKEIGSSLIDTPFRQANKSYRDFGTPEYRKKQEEDNKAFTESIKSLTIPKILKGFGEKAIDTLDPTGTVKGVASLGSSSLEDIKQGNYGGLTANAALAALMAYGAKKAVSPKGIKPELLPQEPKVAVLPKVEPPPPLEPYSLPRSQGIQHFNPAGEVTGRPTVAAKTKEVKVPYIDKTGKKRLKKVSVPVAVSDEAKEAIRLKKISGETVSGDWLNEDPLYSHVPNRLRPEAPNVTVMRALTQGQNPKAKGAAVSSGARKLSQSIEEKAPVTKASEKLPSVEPIEKAAQVSSKKGPLDKVRSNAFYKAIYEPIAVSSLTKLERLGEGGKQLANLLRSERTESARLGGEHALSTRQALRTLNKNEQLEVAQILDGQKPVSQASNQKVANAYTELRKSTEALGDEAVAADVRMKNLKGENIPFQKHQGEYWPRRYDEDFYKKPGSLLEAIYKNDKGYSPAEISAIVKRVTEEGERYSPAQHTRDFDAPGYKMNLGSLAQYQYDMARTITRAKKFGPLNVADPDSIISKLIKQTNNPAEAHKIVNEYLNRTENSATKSAQHKVYNAVVKAQVASKLSQFGITNMGDLASIGSNLGVGNTLKAIKDVITNPHGSADIATRSGSLAILKSELMDEVKGGNLLGKAYGTTTTEKFMRTVGSLAGRAEAKRLFELAKKDSKYAKSLQSFVDEDVSKVLSQDELTPKQLDYASGRAVELSSGVPDKLGLSKAMTAENPLLRLPFLFKRFAFLNTKNMVETVKRQPTMAGKLAKAGTILAAYQLAGEGVGDTKAAIRGLVNGDIEKSLNERGDYIGTGNKVFDRIMANYLQSALFGLVGDTSESIVRKNTGKISGTVAGPVGSDLDELTAALGSASKGDFKPLGKGIIRRVPFIGQGLADSFGKEKKGINSNIQNRMQDELTPDESIDIEAARDKIRQTLNTGRANKFAKSVSDEDLPEAPHPYPYTKQPDVIGDTKFANIVNDFFKKFPQAEGLVRKISNVPNQGVFESIDTANKVREEAAGISPETLKKLKAMGGRLESHLDYEDYDRLNLLGQHDKRSKEIYIKPQEDLDTLKTLAHEYSHAAGLNERETRELQKYFNSFYKTKESSQR